MKTLARKTLIHTIIVLFLVLCVVSGVIWCVNTTSSNAHAETLEPNESTKLTFLLNEDAKSYKVRVLDKTITSITIPSAYNGLPVTDIDDSGFVGCSALEVALIPSSVKRIGNNAFMRCTKLKNVLGMSGVTSYGNNAFSMCSNLEYLILPSSLTNVGTSMLRSVKATVYSRTLEEDLLRLNSACLTSFAGNIVYGDELVYNAYEDPQTGEEGLSLASWQNIDLHPDGFDNNTTLILESWQSNVTLTDGNIADGKVLNIEQCAFSDCNAEEIIIKNAQGYNHSINIESFAFLQCQAKKITIQADITMNDPSGSVSEEIFNGCEDLESIVLPDTIDTISTRMFYDCKALFDIKYYNSTIEANHLSSKIKRIEDQAFYSCYSLPELNITDSIEFIGEFAFFYWGTNDELYQEIYIDLKEAGNNWAINWDAGVNEDNAYIGFLGIKEFTVEFIVAQENVLNPSGYMKTKVSRNGKVSDFNVIEPIADSHIFNGIWYTSELRNEGTEYDLNRPVRYDLKLYAGWNIKIFDVIFPQEKCCSFHHFQNTDCLDGETKQFSYGETFSFYCKTRNGYENIQLFNGENSLTPVNGNVYTLEITSEINLSVEYELHEYSITYSNVRGGNNPNEITTYTIESDKITFKKPSWKAYKSGEWDISYIENGSTGDREISAIWNEPIKFTITYELGDDPHATIPNTAIKSYTVDNIVSLKDPISPGYESGVWINKNGETISGWDKDKYFEDMTLYAQWGNGRAYRVKFDLNGGIGDNTEIDAVYGQPLPTKEEIPTKNDYKFLGYYSVKNGQRYYDSGMAGQVWYQANEDTLRAEWEKEYFYVTFVQKNGTGVGGTQHIRVKKGEDWESIMMPTRQGYRISGYYYGSQSEDNKVYNANGTYIRNNKVVDKNVAEDMTLYCYWEISQYYYFVIDKINYVAPTATGIDEFKLAYDGSYDYTAPQTNKWIEYSADGKDIISTDTREFTIWRIRLNGHNGGDISTNPWMDFTKDRELRFNVSTIIEQYYPNYKETDTIYFRAIYNKAIDDGCVAEGTLITLADGSKKAVEDLTGDERLLVWNLHTGQLDTAPILFIDRDPFATYVVINLTFSDGTNLKVISEHGLWDYNLNKYVYLDQSASQYIGHWFNKQSLDNAGNIVTVKVQLTDVLIREEQTMPYSPVTYGHMCYYVNGLLSMPGGIDGLFNIFEVDEETMQYDEMAMESDIAKYGLYTYEEFVELVPVAEEMFNAVQGQYLKVAVGKGLITIEDIRVLVDRYSVFFE